MPTTASLGAVNEPDHQLLRDLADYQMPYGKYKGRRLLDLPEAYLSWFQRQGWPEGRMGQLLATAFELKINGLTGLLDPLREDDGRDHRS